MGEVIVVCVKWGTKYRASYVNILRNMVRRNLSVPHEFVCFTEDGSGLDRDITVRPLPDPLEGWWNKVSLFRPGLFPQSATVIFLDLDLVIVASINFLLDGGEPFKIVSNFERIGMGKLKTREQCKFNSSVMRISPGACDHVFRRFRWRWLAFRSFRTDQDWISYCCPDAATFPAGKIVSFKRTMDSGDEPPPGTAIVLFHGRPNPHEIGRPFLQQHWH